MKNDNNKRTKANNITKKKNQIKTNINDNVNKINKNCHDEKQKNIQNNPIKNKIVHAKKKSTNYETIQEKKKLSKNEEITDNSIDTKMFYDTNKDNNIVNYNTPIKTKNIYRNTVFFYTNNELVSNLLCDEADDNKKVMVSELDVDISNSQSINNTSKPKFEIPPQPVIQEKNNKENDFRTQLELNLKKILEKTIMQSNTEKKIKSEKNNCGVNFDKIDKTEKKENSDKEIKNNINNDFYNNNKENNNKEVLSNNKEIANKNENFNKNLNDKSSNIIIDQINISNEINNSIEKNKSINNSNKNLKKFNGINNNSSDKNKNFNQNFIDKYKDKLNSNERNTTNSKVNKFNTNSNKKNLSNNIKQIIEISVNNILNENEKRLSDASKFFGKKKPSIICSAKIRKDSLLKSPKNNIHQFNNINNLSPNNKYNKEKRKKKNNFSKTDNNGIKKYKTIYEQHKKNNNNQIENNTKHYNKIKKPKNIISVTSKKNLKSHATTSNNNNCKKICSKKNNILTLYSPFSNSNIKNENLNSNSNNLSQEKKNQIPYFKYKNILNELHYYLSGDNKDEITNNSKTNSHRNKKNPTYLIFSFDGGRTTKHKINSNSTFIHRYDNSTLFNSNHNISINNKKIMNSSNPIESENILNKNNSDINNNIQNSIIYHKRKWGKYKNNSCQFNKKFNGIFSDSIIDTNYKLNNEIITTKNIKLNNMVNNCSSICVSVNCNKGKKNFKNKTINSLLKKSESNQIMNRGINNNSKLKNNKNNSNYNMITFRNKFINDDYKKYNLSNSKDNKQHKTFKKLKYHGTKEHKYANTNNNNSNNIIKDKNLNTNNNDNYIDNKINIDINIQNNINYTYIVRKNTVKTKSNNHLFSMK